tara:strand:+ start:258 stop:479 length:222 start_codon:yes stop_codon:yes gene_type:complete
MTNVFAQVYNELTLLQTEEIDDLNIAEQGLNAAMMFTIENAPSTLHGIQLISHCFHDIINGCVYNEMENERKK